MRPLNMPPPQHTGTPVRGHPMPYGAPAPAGYPYYAMPPHSHMPPPPPGYAMMHARGGHAAGNPVSPDAQGNLPPKHPQFSNYHAATSPASMKRTPPRSMGASPPRQMAEGSSIPFNPSTGPPPQRVAHPSPPRSAYPPDSYAFQTVEGNYSGMPAVTPQRTHTSPLPPSKPSPQFANPDKSSPCDSPSSYRKSPSPTASASSSVSSKGNGKNAFPACLMSSNSRFDSSLGILTKKFVFLLKRAASHGFLENGVTIGPKANGGGGTLDLNIAAEQLGVQKRRIYDITNVLEGIGLIEKRTKNHIAWVHDPRPGSGDGSAALSASPHDNSENGLEEVSSNIICRGEEQMLKDEVDALKNEEEKLDKHITYMMNLVKSYSNCPRGLKVGNKNGNPWMYIRKDDLTSLEELKDETVIAVRAPAGTTLDVPDPNDGMTPGSRKYQMYFNSPSEKIDVFLIQYGDDNNKSKCDVEKSNEFGQLSTKRQSPLPGADEAHDRKRQRRLDSEWQGAPADNNNYLAGGLSPNKMDQARSPSASYYSSWEKHASLSSSEQKLPQCPEQRDERSEENEASDYGFGLPPRNTRRVAGSPRMHREIEATSSNSIVTASTGNSNSNHTPTVAVGDSHVDAADSSPAGSFDLMDDQFDFFNHPFTEQNEDFLDFQPTV